MGYDINSIQNTKTFRTADQIFDPLQLGPGSKGVSNGYQATQYDPNAAAYQIDNQYGGNLASALAGAQGRSAPTVAGPDLSQSNQIRDQQQSLIAALQARASGRSPSVAEMQLHQGLGSALQSQASVAASQRGISPGMAARLQAQGTAGLQQQTNAQAAQLRAGEQSQAEGALAGALGNYRGQDLSAAGLSQQSSLANQQAELANRAQMDQATQAYIAQGMSREQAQQQALADQEKLKADQRTSANQINADVAKQNMEAQQKQKAGVLGAVGSVIGGIFSDERLKENIAPADGDVRTFLDLLEAKKFDYKSPRHGGKGVVGFMAQDAEKSSLGKAMVIETHEGKAIDPRRALVAALASAAHLNKRLARLEGVAR